MWSTAVSGMVFRSVAAAIPLADEPLTQRTPSTRTSTRLEPRYRRSASVAPAPMPPPSGGAPKLPVELYLPLIAPPETGSCCRISPTDVRPVRSRSSRDSIKTGACLPSGSPMREPVTTMTSPSVGGVGSTETGTSSGAGLAGGFAGGVAPGDVTGAGGVVSEAGGGASGVPGAASGDGGAGDGAGVGDGAGWAAWAMRADFGRMCNVLCALAVLLVVTRSAVSP